MTGDRVYRHAQMALLEMPVTGDTAVLADCWHRAHIPAGHRKHEGWPASIRCTTCGKRRAVVSVIHPKAKR